MPQFKIVISGDKSLADNVYFVLNEIDPLGAAATTIFPDETRQSKWQVDAYFEDCPGTENFTAQLQPLMTVPLPAGSVCRVEVPDENWVEKVQKDLAPVSAGCFLIHGSHDIAVAGGHPYPIQIDAGEAFGTAHHGTTTGCLEMISTIASGEKHRNCLDLGTGSGILAIALAKKLTGVVKVTGSDLDPISVRVAQENARNNNVAGKIKFVTADGLNSPALADAAPYDLIVANILAEPLIFLAPDIAKVARSGANLILSGLLNEQALTVVAAYKKAGFTMGNDIQRGEWTTLHLTRTIQNLRESKSKNE